jgi:hypothetical protein
VPEAILACLLEHNGSGSEKGDGKVK